MRVKCYKARGAEQVLGAQQRLVQGDMISDDGDYDSDDCDDGDDGGDGGDDDSDDETITN